MHQRLKRRTRPHDCVTKVGFRRVAPHDRVECHAHVHPEAG